MFSLVKEKKYNQLNATKVQQATSLLSITSCTNIVTSSSILMLLFSTSARLLDLVLIPREEFALLVITLRTQQ